ncbi:hypothetical protein ACFY3U_10665 [Micromonospora sp. NPDC000089]|uniref:hypothetical protein n=1 Tax=unclassified Micromonospora TaxID=2617518 RepID=UPI0036CC9BEC
MPIRFRRRAADPPSRTRDPLRWLRRRAPVPPPPSPVPRPRVSWENAPTRVLPTMEPGRAGNLTPAQRWRAGGWRRNPDRPYGEQR